MECRRTYIALEQTPRVVIKSAFEAKTAQQRGFVVIIIRIYDSARVDF